MEKWRVFRDALTAGLMIGIGGSVYLACENKALGAVLFSVGLMSICVFGLNLFTGKIGYAIATRNRPDCALIWLGNLCGCMLCALLIRLAFPALAERAASLVTAKLELCALQAVIRGFFCGILMYIAVDNFKNNRGDFGRYLGILLCVPVFILSGFEHSVADMFYCALGVQSAAQALHCVVFLLLVTLGNSLGALVFWVLTRKKAAPEPAAKC